MMVPTYFRCLHTNRRGRGEKLESRWVGYLVEGWMDAARMGFQQSLGEFVKQ